MSSEVTFEPIQEPDGSGMIKGRRRKMDGEGVLLGAAGAAVRQLQRAEREQRDRRARICTVLQLAVSRSWSVHQLDVSNAFLHGHLAEQVFCEQPTGFVDAEHPDFGADTAYLLLYVDDIILTASAPELLQRLTARLRDEFALKDLGPLHYFLGVEVVRRADGFFLHQQKYDHELLDRAVPAPTRPDLQYAIQQVCLHMHAPRDSHWTLVKRILRYIRGTMSLGLTLTASSTDLVAYSDADWVGCPDTRRSTSGYCVYLGPSLIS
nr:uncharacterized mitochondrial protein AtMg00810-like [Aegilops tauschii subsp. strangulata]